MKQRQQQLPSVGYVRLPTILSVYPVSRATWYNMIREGTAPQPVKLSERISAWRVADIRNLLGDAQ